MASRGFNLLSAIKPVFPAISSDKAAYNMLYFCPHKHNKLNINTTPSEHKNILKKIKIKTEIDNNKISFQL